MRHVLVTVAARAGNRWARRRVGEEPAQSQSAVGCDVSVRPVWQVIPYGMLSPMLQFGAFHVHQPLQKLMYGGCRVGNGWN